MAVDPSSPPDPAADAAAPRQPRVRRGWYVLCFSGDLARGGHLVRTLFGTPVVVFRGEDGAVGALVDRCPHRNVPLSAGQVVGGELACGYHGWRFEPGGRCTHVPALIGEADHPARRCPSFVVREQQGVVWVWAEPGGQPDHEPFSFRLTDDPTYTVVTRVLEAAGSVHAVAENALDVPHTAFLHGGLFRVDADRNEIACRVTRHHDRVACEYIGEPRPDGLVGRILSPSGGVVTHFDRFYLPSIVEVEYRIGEENHILVNAALTPMADHQTMLHAVAAIRARVPIWLIKPVALRAALHIFGQDQAILAAQTENLRRFGDARFASTELDALGPHILRLLRQAERGELDPPDRPPVVRDFKMQV